MTWITYLPLVVVGAVSGIVLLARASRRLDRLVSKFALATFGLYVDIRGPQSDRDRLLQAAYVETPYRVYASRVLLHSAVAALAGSVVGVYLVSGVFIAIPPTRAVLVDVLPFYRHTVAALLSVPDLAPLALFWLLLVSSATVGSACWVVVSRLHWSLLEVRAHSRRRAIELTTPGVLAFMYALARGGLELPRILAILRRHQPLYGEAAAELAIAAKDVNEFGIDTVAALRDVSDRTPSEQFRVFTENLASVIQSGRSVSDFLREQYEQFQEEAQAHQELFLDRLGALAEAYVAVFVVGPLFLLTVLLIFGLISGGTTGAMAAIIYVVMPAMNLAFMYYLDRSTGPFGTNRVESTMDAELPDVGDVGVAAATEAGEPAEVFWSPSIHAGERPSSAGTRRPRANFERLVAHDRVRSFRRTVSDPIAHVRRRPAAILYAVVPLALLWFLARAIQLGEGATVATLDDVFVQSTLLVVVPFAVARRYHTARLRAIERAVPDLFNRLASMNQAGVEIVDAFEQVRHGDLGPLTFELDRLWIDIQFGADLETALNRLERRFPAPSIKRAVTLINKGLAASGNIAPVLQIAADESRRLNTLKRQRQQELSIYLIIIYLAFLVFLTIISVLIGTFIPALPTQAALEGAGLRGVAAGITQAEAELYTVLLFHASLVQAVFSGLVAGQMAQESVHDGAQHVAILMGVAYVLFALLA